MRIANFERGNNILSRNKSLIILHPLDVCIKLRNERIEKKESLLLCNQKLLAQNSDKIVKFKKKNTCNHNRT